MSAAPVLPERAACPDFGAMVRARFATPADLLTSPDPASIGRAVLRQLQAGDSAPGGKAKLRASALGKCQRALAFRWHDVPEDGRRIDGRSRSTFAMGDMAEGLLVTVLAEALAGGAAPGWRLDSIRTRKGQAAVTLRVRVGRKLLKIPGHPDGLVTLRHGRRILERVVLEVKSTSSYGFTEWSKALAEGRDPWTPAESYWWQLQGYLRAMKVQRGYVLALCKDSGAIAGWWVEADPAYHDRLAAHLAPVLRSTHPAEVPRLLPDGTELAPVEKIGKRGAPIKGHGDLPRFPCGYCAHYRPCWGHDRLIEEVSTDWRGRPSLSLRLRDDTEILPGIVPDNTAAHAAVGG